MSKIEEILHRLTTEERNLIKNKIRAKDQKIAELEKALELACKYIAYAEMVSNPEIANEYTSIDSYKNIKLNILHPKQRRS